MLVGFVFWYRGLAQGGVAAVSQLQLLQPLFKLLLASLLLHEPVMWLIRLAAVAVIGCVAGARRFTRGARAECNRLDIIGLVRRCMCGRCMQACTYSNTQFPLCEVASATFL